MAPDDNPRFVDEAVPSLLDEMTEPAVMEAAADVACEGFEDELEALEFATLELAALDVTTEEDVDDDDGGGGDGEAELDVSARDVAADVDIDEEDPEAAADAARETDGA